MRHGRLAAALLAVVARAACAQELVVDGGLEAYSRCPTGIGVMNGYAVSWYRGGVGSTDYMNSCGFSPVPARTGEGHAGFIPWDASGPYREYLVGELAAPLAAGREYRVEMWVILREGMLRAVQEIGAWLSPALPSFPGTGPPAGVVPQVENATGPLIDKVSWMQVSGTFTAAGGEQYITIGNFHDDAGTTLHEWPCCGALQSYYDIDDISLTEVGAPPEPCLWRSDASAVDPLTPPAASIFGPESPQGVSLQGASWQCPIADGDLERDPAALATGLPLTFYQVGEPAAVLRLEKAGTTIRFRL